MSENTKQSSILIVEDEPGNVKILNSLLSGSYNITVAETGEKAEEILSAGNIPDLILLDIVMPGKDGYEVCENIKKMPGAEDVPVIFLSGKTDTKEIVKGFRAGAVDFVTKPFKPQELLTRVETQLDLLESKKELERANQQLRDRNYEIEKGMEFARLLQRKLLPSYSPEASWIKSAFSFIPMDKVGGDFYDYNLKDDSLELFIADVSGHGLPGAIFSTITKVTKEQADNNNSPSAILTQLNSIMNRYTFDGYFITAFSSVLDRKTMKMKFSSAGHTPALVLRGGSDEILELKTRGTPLGAFENYEYAESEIKMESGDRIIIYTDGITECSRYIYGKTEMWGDDSFLEFLNKNRSLSPEELCDKLIKELSVFCGTRNFDDDITLGVVDIL